MQQDSIDWLDAKKGVDHHIARANERLESWQEITYTVDALKKQNTELKVGHPHNDHMNASKCLHSQISKTSFPIICYLAHHTQFSHLSCGIYQQMA